MPMTTTDVDAYLTRIGFDREVTLDRSTLEGLQRAHLSTVPFENLDVFNRVGVHTGLDWSIPKIVDRRRGGWCFEANGAFGALLEAQGFTVLRLGAAVLLGGPNRTIDHLVLEVSLDQPYLVDVGFGDCFIRPLALNSREPQDGGTGMFQFLDSPEGLTLTQLDDSAIPVPQYRFRRVDHALSDFDAASDRLQSDHELHWRQKPFATRLIDGGPDRVTLVNNRLKVTKGGTTTETPVKADDWYAMLERWFGIQLR